MIDRENHGSPSPAFGPIASKNKDAIIQEIYHRLDSDVSMVNIQEEEFETG